MNKILGNQVYAGGAAINGGQGEQAVITLTGDSGTLTDAQITQVLNDTASLAIVCDGQVFRLANKQSDLGYRTYINVDCALESTIAVKAIYIRVDGSPTHGNWTKETVPVA